MIVIGRDHRTPGATSSRTNSAGMRSRCGDEGHLRGDLPGPGPLQLGAAVVVHAGRGGSPPCKLDHRCRSRCRAPRRRRGRAASPLVRLTRRTGTRRPPRVRALGSLRAARDWTGGHGTGSATRLWISFFSLRRHYPVRFIRSTAPSRPLSAPACAPAGGIRSRNRTSAVPHIYGPKNGTDDFWRQVLWRLPCRPTSHDLVYPNGIC